MKQPKHLFTPALALLLLCLVACINVEIIDNSDRINSSLIKVTFDWNGEEADKPQYLHLIAVRNVMTWRAHGYVNTDEGNAPWFGYSEPIIEEKPEEEPVPQPEPDPNPEPTPDDGNIDNEGTTDSANNEEDIDIVNESDDAIEPDQNTDSGNVPEPNPEPETETKYPFRLRGGEYNILAVNTNIDSETVELKCLKEGQEVNNPEGEITSEENSLISYLKDPTRKANELYLCLKSNIEKPDIVKDKDLPDFNPQFEYVDSVPRIFYTLQTGFNVVPGTDAHLHLDMQPISQEIRVEFTIELNGNIEIQEEPVVELSGICGRFNLMEAYVDTTTLYRSVVKAEPISQSGNQYVYQARFHTLGVLPSFSPTYLNGPGVIQLAVKAQSTQTGANKDGRYIYAGINPHTELNESQIVIEGTDGKMRLRFSREPIIVKVEKHLIIDEDFLIDPGNGLGWEQHDPDIDIDIDI